MTERRKIMIRTVPFLVFGVLAFILYVTLFVDVPKMIGVIQRANMVIYSFAAFALILETLFFALNWQGLLHPLSINVPLKKTFTYVWIGIFADLLIPAESVSGDIAKAYFMSKEPNVNAGKVIASLVSQRVLGTFMTAVTLIVSFLALLSLNYPISGLMLQILVLLTAVASIAFVLLVMLCLKEKWTARLIDAAIHFVERVSKGRLKLERFQTSIADALKSFYESLRTFGSKPTKLILPALFYVSAWLFSILIVFLVFVSIGYLEPNVPILLLQVTVVYTLLVGIKSIPIGVPAEIGLPDIVMTTLFSLFGIPLDISAAATLLTRIITVWLSFTIGFAAVQLLGVKNLMESGVFGKTKDKV